MNESGNNFCSRSCSAKVTNKIHPKRKPEHKCKECEKPITANYRYCSLTCRNRSKYKRRVERGTVDTNSSSKRVTNYRRELKIRMVNELGGKCKICGFDKYPCSLQFHHINQSDKSFNISDSIRAYRKNIEELKKCILLCNNCHTALHNGFLTLDIES